MKWNNIFNRETSKEKKEYSRPGDGSKAILYYLVAIYIGYMGYSILHNRLTGDDTLSYPVAILFTSVFAIGAAWIVWYATKLRKNASAAEIQVDTIEELHETVPENIQEETKNY